MTNSMTPRTLIHRSQNGEALTATLRRIHRSRAILTFDSPADFHPGDQLECEWPGVWALAEVLYSKHSRIGVRVVAGQWAATN